MRVGRLESLGILSSTFVAARQVDVWLPESYERATSERFPVMFMHDGQNLFLDDLSFIGVSWGMDEAMARVERETGGRTAIIVGIWNTEERIPEYMPQKPLVENPGILRDFCEEEGDPQSDAYLRFIVEELKPLIDRRYRTRSGVQDTYIAGSSMGGLISIYAVCEYPHVFSGAACFSTAWPVGSGVTVEYLRSALPPAGHHRLYFDHGTVGLDATYPPFQEKVDVILQEAGYTEGKDWMTCVYEGDEHSERAWRKRAHIPMKFMLCGSA